MSAALTRNQQLVLDTLRGSDGPRTAYALLDDLRDEGLRAPPQVYRALDALIGQGAVHRLESLNAFVACRHGHCGGAGCAVFAICDRCDGAEEMGSDKLDEAVSALSADRGFAVSRAVVELRGTCAACADARV